jgi:hypothetical protein
LSSVIYGYDAWFFTLTEEYRLWVFTNRVLRRIFGSRRNKVAGSWRRVQEELHDLYNNQVLFTQSNQEKLYRQCM